MERVKKTIIDTKIDLNNIFIDNYIPKKICEIEGYDFVGPLNIAQLSAQSVLYAVRKGGKDFVLKHHKSFIVGRKGQGLQGSGGVFKTQKYNEKVDEVEKTHFFIERALAEEPVLKNCPHIVNVHIADKIEFIKGDPSDNTSYRITAFYTIMDRYIPLSLDWGAYPDIRSEKEALKLGVDICDALAVMNSETVGRIFNRKNSKGENKKLVHSDIKFENIMYLQDDEHGNYVLIDFGVSKLKGLETTYTTAEPGGTNAYLPPETVSRKYSSKIDLYALCATLYVLVNEGTLDEALPKCRVGSNENNKKYVLFKGEMSAPKNASNELSNLLVNQLEFNPKKRTCKSAGELKASLQRIQFHHAVKAYNREDFDLFNSYMGDLKIKEIDDPTLLGSICDFLFSEKIYDYLDYFIDLACGKNIPKGLYLDGIMWRDGIGHVRVPENAEIRFSDAVKFGLVDPATKKLAKAALNELDIQNYSEKHLRTVESQHPKFGILKLIMLCGFVIVGMGMCLTLSRLIEWEYACFLGAGLAIVIAYIAAIGCSTLLEDSPFGTIVADLLEIFLLLQTLPVLYWSFDLFTLKSLMLFPAACIVLGFTLVEIHIKYIHDVFDVSPIRIVNYFVCGVAFTIACVLFLFNYVLAILLLACTTYLVLCKIDNNDRIKAACGIDKRYAFDPAHIDTDDLPEANNQSSSKEIFIYNSSGNIDYILHPICEGVYDGDRYVLAKDSSTYANGGLYKILHDPNWNRNYTIVTDPTLLDKLLNELKEELYFES